MIKNEKFFNGIDSSVTLNVWYMSKFNFHETALSSLNKQINLFCFFFNKNVNLWIYKYVFFLELKIKNLLKYIQ